MTRLREMVWEHRDAVVPVVVALVVISLVVWSVRLKDPLTPDQLRRLIP